MIVVSDFRPEVQMLPFLRMRHDEVVEMLENISWSIKYSAISAYAPWKYEKIVRDVVKLPKLQSNVHKFGNKTAYITNINIHNVKIRSKNRKNHKKVIVLRVVLTLRRQDRSQPLVNVNVYYSHENVALRALSSIFHFPLRLLTDLSPLAATNGLAQIVVY